MSEMSRFLKNYSVALKSKATEPDNTKQFRPPIVVSRQVGSGGKLVAEELAARLGFEMCDKRILEEIASKSHAPPDLLELLDERPHSRLELFGATLLRGAGLNLEEFDRYLRIAIRGMLDLGSVVILGRGAGFLAAPGKALRIKIVAPLDSRVANIMRLLGVSEKEARAKITATDKEREAFYKRVYHKSEMTADMFDIGFNTQTLALGDIVELSLSAYAKVCSEQPELSVS